MGNRPGAPGKPDPCGKRGRLSDADRAVLNDMNGLYKYLNRLANRRKPIEKFYGADVASLISELRSKMASIRAAHGCD